MDRDELKKTIDRCVPSILKTALDTRDPFAGVFLAAAIVLSKHPFFDKGCFTHGGYLNLETDLESLAASSIAALAQIRLLIGEGFSLSDDSITFYKHTQNDAIDQIIQARMCNDVLEGDADL